MASQASLGSSDAIVQSDELNYKQRMFSHPEYKLQFVPPNTYGAPIVLGTSTVPIQFNIPASVFNWDPTELSFDVTIPSGGVGRFTWYALQALKEISQIEFVGTATSAPIVDIKNFQNYVDLILKKELEREEFLTLDPMTGISASNSLVNMIPALRNANTTVVNTPGLATYPSSINYTEPAYYSVTPTAAALQYKVMFRMGLLKNTFFSVNKDFYYGQIMYLRLTFGPLAKVCYTSDSNNNPSAGAKLSFPTAGVIENLKLMIAVETNKSIADKVKAECTAGMSYIIPYVISHKNSSGTSDSQNINIPLDAGVGMTLCKVIHAVYNSLEDVDLAYDHANTLYNEKVIEYNTQLSGENLQATGVKCRAVGPYNDYMYHKKQLSKSILANMDVYKYNWFHCDDFTRYGNEYIFDGRSELISGVPLGDVSTTWSFSGTQTRANAFFHYTYCVVTRKLTIRNGQIEVSVR